MKASINNRLFSGELDGLYRAALLVMIVMGLLIVPSGCAMRRSVGKIGYSIQVGAFSRLDNAQRLTDRLRDKGIDAFYFKKESGLYAVRFGDFSSKKEADKIARRMISEGVIKDYYITPPVSVSRPAEVTAYSPETETFESQKSTDIGFIAARTAERFVGIPYRWGGNNVVEGMDCSGFVRAVYNLVGVRIPRTSKNQFAMGQGVKKRDLRDGDLVFFGSSTGKVSHVGIYVGSGRFAHAPRKGKDIMISSLKEGQFSRNFVGARRYF